MNDNAPHIPMGIIQSQKFNEAIQNNIIVIPGITRWECIRCGDCCSGIAVHAPIGLRPEDGADRCRYLADAKVLEIPSSVGAKGMSDMMSGSYEPKAKCWVYEDRPTFCRAFPFIVYYYGHERYLMINRRCRGISRGEPFTVEDYKEWMDFFRHYGEGAGPSEKALTRLGDGK